MSHHHLRIAFLHLSPQAGMVYCNRLQIINALQIASIYQVDWAITPELAESGYQFNEFIGTNWIKPLPTNFTHQLAWHAYEKNATYFIGMPTKDSFTGKLYNSIAILNPKERKQQSYSKVHVVDVPAENWATPGKGAMVERINEIPVGFLICADAYWPDVALASKKMGAKILLSSAAWPPGECGPNGEWEARSKETGLPVLVCNRTGKEPNMDFSKAESVVVANGKRMFTFISKTPAIFIIDMDLQSNTFNFCTKIDLCNFY